MTCSVEAPVGRTLTKHEPIGTTLHRPGFAAELMAVGKFKNMRNSYYYELQICGLDWF